MSNEPLWPSDYGVHPDHCRDVIDGCYDVPFNPETPPTVLDLGGNVGAFVRFAVNRWPGCMIHSYEPHPQNFALLKRTVADYGNGHSVVFHNEAVAKVAGTAPLYRGEFNCGEWSLVMGQGNPSVNVSIIAASTLPKADILKIDTEGAEPFILQRLIDIGRITEFSAIMLEYHRAGEEISIPAMLAPHGFKVFSHRPGITSSRGELKFARA